MRERFRPEFLNRIDEIVRFEPLRASRSARSSSCSSARCARGSPSAGSSRAHDAAKEHLAEAGWDPTYGARPLKRAIQRLVENPLALRLLEGEFAEGDTVRVDVRDGELVEFDRAPSPAPAAVELRHRLRSPGAARLAGAARRLPQAERDRDAALEAGRPDSARPGVREAGRPRSRRTHGLANAGRGGRADHAGRPAAASGPGVRGSAPPVRAGALLPAEAAAAHAAARSEEGGGDDLQVLDGVPAASSMEADAIRFRTPLFTTRTTMRSTWVTTRPASRPAAQRRKGGSRDSRPRVLGPSRWSRQRQRYRESCWSAATRASWPRAACAGSARPSRPRRPPGGQWNGVRAKSCTSVSRAPGRSSRRPLVLGPGGVRGTNAAIPGSRAPSRTRVRRGGSARRRPPDRDERAWGRSPAATSRRWWALPSFARARSPACRR